MASVCGINLQDRFCFPFLALTPCPFLVLFIANPLARCVPLRFLVFFTLLPLDLVLQKQQSASKSPYEKIRIPKSARQRADAGWVWPCGSHSQPAKTLTKKSGFRKARVSAQRADALGPIPMLPRPTHRLHLPTPMFAQVLQSHYVT
jgi:hypothetical protein